MKILLFYCYFMVMAFSASAQLPDGSFAPDFTLQDLNGKTWHLYELLDQGKNVIIDFSATWCPSCWVYHEKGRFNELYSAYGPDGTDEFMVFFIEGDPETNIDCLYDLPGCEGNSPGDWTAGTLYPIINDDFIAWEYEIAYWPTFFQICPNRLVTQVPSSSPKVEDMYAMKDLCAVTFGNNNAAVLEYVGFSGLFCSIKSFNPAVRIQNLGIVPITDLTAECWVNGVLEQTISWTGNVVSYATAIVEFGSVTVNGDADIKVMVTEVNGSSDEDLSNNEIVAQTISLEPREQNMLQLELRTDYYPKEIYWEITNGDGDAIYKGGNPMVIGLPEDGGTYTEFDTSYFYQIPVPEDGCYKFSIYDEDGIYQGYYKISEPDGHIIIEGDEFFTEEEHVLFGISQATNPISYNASISKVNGFPEEFCSGNGYTPSIELVNVGSEYITDAEIELLVKDEVLNTVIWSGIILKGKTAIISFPLTQISNGDEITFRIKSINGQIDAYDFSNTKPVNIKWNNTEDHELELEMQLDHWAHEVYWQMTNSAGEVVASGGNTKVGPNGGGARIATPGDPGAYSPDELVKEQIDLSDSVGDCYTFLVVDDFGDGFFYNGYVSFTGRNDGIEFVNINYYPLTFTTDEIILDVNPLISAVQPFPEIDHLRIYPNPAQEELNLAISMDKNLLLTISVFNMLGEVIMKLPATQYSIGSNDISLDISSFPNGVYTICLESDGKQVSRKFSIVR